MDEQQVLQINRDGWNKVAEQFFEGEKAQLSYGPYAPTEEELNLLGNVDGAAILEIGCGSGHTLQYLAKRGAQELWGVDLSSKQIQTAREVLMGCYVKTTLLEAPMENIPMVPERYFDIAVSIFALGWTSNLENTLENIYRTLQPGGRFIFSWEHPFHSSLKYENGKFVIDSSYIQEGQVERKSWRGVPIVIHHRTIGTFLNQLIKAGFRIDKLVEASRFSETDESQPTQWYSKARAELSPSTFIVRCFKE